MCGVKKVAKAILIPVAVVAVVAVVAMLAVNLYVQSPGARKRIQTELSSALNTPLRITNTSLSPWGLSINGITIPDQVGTTLEAASFKAGYRFLPLLRGELVVSEMTLERPTLVWTQNAEGKWVWPHLNKGDDRKMDAAIETPPEEQPKREKASDRFKVSVSGFKVNHGMVELLDFSGNKIVTFTEVNMAYSELSKERIAGFISIGHVVWGGGVAIDELRTPFTFDEGKLKLPDLQGKIGGGTLQASGEARTKKRDMPFEFELHLDQVNLALLSTAAGWPAGTAGGLLSGRLDLNGNVKEFARSEGKGHLLVTQGQFRQLDFFQTIGQVLGIPELADLRLKQARAEFRIADEKAFIETLMLEAPDLRLSAQGVARFDKALSLEAKLSVSDAIRLPSFVKENFASTDSTGNRAIDFKIGGRIDRPKTDLAEKLVGRRIGDQLEDLVTSLFGGKKKKKDEGEKKKDKEKKKKQESGEPVVPVSPEAPAVPAAAAPDPMPEVPVTP